MLLFLFVVTACKSGIGAIVVILVIAIIVVGAVVSVVIAVPVEPYEVGCVAKAGIKEII